MLRLTIETWMVTFFTLDMGSVSTECFFAQDRVREAIDLAIREGGVLARDMQELLRPHKPTRELSWTNCMGLDFN